jgi:Ala-tRNA(Pro) deacylase
MSIAATLQKHLARKHIEYDVVRHPRTTTSISAAEACQVSPNRLAKGVVLRTRDSYILAVLPASHRIDWASLEAQFGETFALATEHELGQLFEDCARGAIPPVGECYGLDAVVEDSIRDPPQIYFEGGDHATLVRVSQTEFAELTRNARRARFAANA